MAYIDRDDLGIGKCNPDVFEDKGYAKGWNAAIEIIQNALAANVRQVVLCKDCIHRNEEMTNMNGYHRCDRCGWQDLDNRIYMPDDGFCSYGTKKKLKS